MQYIFKFFGIVFVIISAGFIGLALFNTTSPASHLNQSTSKPASNYDNHEALPYATPEQLQNLSSINSDLDHRSRQDEEYRRKLEVLKSFKKTCGYWTKEFNNGHSERTRLFMNSSCRDAENYARKELNHRPRTPNYVAHQSRASGRPRAIILNNATKGKSTSGKCSRWKTELENINKRFGRGYKEPTGNRLRKRRHQLNNLLGEKC